MATVHEEQCCQDELQIFQRGLKINTTYGKVTLFFTFPERLGYWKYCNSTRKEVTPWSLPRQPHRVTARATEKRDVNVPTAQVGLRIRFSKYAWLQGLFMDAFIGTERNKHCRKPMVVLVYDTLYCLPFLVLLLSWKLHPLKWLFYWLVAQAPSRQWVVLSVEPKPREAVSDYLRGKK